MPVRDGIRGRPQEFLRGRGRESGAVVVEFEEGAAFFYVVGCCWGGDAGRGWVSGRRLFALGKIVGLPEFTGKTWVGEKRRVGRERQVDVCTVVQGQQ